MHADGLVSNDVVLLELVRHQLRADHFFVRWIMKQANGQLVPTSLTR